MQQRTKLGAELREFLAGRSSRPRSVVLSGEPGIGKSWLVDNIVNGIDDTLVHSVVVFDDIDILSESEAIEKVRAAREGDKSIVIAGRSVSEALVSEIDRLFERRVVRLSQLSDSCIRDLLESLGELRWGFRTGVIVGSAKGNPRLAIDAMYSWDQFPDVSTDSTFHWMRDFPIFQAWYQSSFGNDLVPSAESSIFSELESDLIEIEKLARSFEFNECLKKSDVLCVKAQNVGCDWIYLWAAGTGAWVRGALGDGMAVQSLHSILNAATQRGYIDLCVQIWLALSTYFYHVGELELSEQACRSGLSLADENNLFLGPALVLREMYGAVLYQTNQSQLAMLYASEILEIAEREHYSTIASFASQSASRASFASGNISQARLFAERSLSLASTQSTRLEASIGLARVHSETGNLKLALATLGEPEELRISSESQDYYIAITAVRSIVSNATDVAESLELANRWLPALKALAISEIGGSAEAALLEAQGWIAFLDGNDSQADVDLGRASDLWTKYGCIEDVQEIQRIRTRIGSMESTVSVATVDVFAELTRREREIAELVSSGMTNPEIAGELYLSPRTVEHHVGSILRKLELPNRRALVHQRRAQVAAQNNVA